MNKKLNYRRPEDLINKPYEVYPIQFQYDTAI